MPHVCAQVNDMHAVQLSSTFVLLLNVSGSNVHELVSTTLITSYTAVIVASGSGEKGGAGGCGNFRQLWCHRLQHAAQRIRVQPDLRAVDELHWVAEVDLCLRGTTLKSTLSAVHATCFALACSTPNDNRS
jgi:hypothetical protein